MTPVDWRELADGDAGIVQTLARMRQEALRATRDPYVVQIARRLVSRVEDRRDPGAFAGAIYQWVSEHVRFVPDPTMYELVIPPRPMLVEIARTGSVSEDCESISTLLMALFEAIGLPSRFHVISQDAPAPGDHGFSHVWTDALIRGRWVPFDATLPDPRPGERPRGLITSEAVYQDRLTLVKESPRMSYFRTVPMRRLGQWEGASWEMPAETVAQTDIFAAEPPVTVPQADIFAEPSPGERMTYPVSPRGAPVSSPGAPNPQVPATSTSGIDWSGIFGGIAKGAATVLPVLERYGAIRPAPQAVAAPPGYVRPTGLQLPAWLRMPDVAFAREYGLSPAAIQAAQQTTPLVLGGGALLLLFLFMRQRG